jgi:hypothetical protein
MKTNLQIGSNLLKMRLRPKPGNTDPYYGACYMEGQNAVWCNNGNDYDLSDGDIVELESLGFIIHNDGEISFYFGNEEEIDEN